MLTDERLREVLHYDPMTGDFTRLVGTARRVNVGDIAGSTNGQGYREIMIDRRRYLSHRLAWLYMTGRWPIAQIDHIDIDRANNRWANLREASRSQNQGNTRVPSTNTSGFKGVSLDKESRKWRAQIRAGGKKRWLGSFNTPDAAHAAYCAAAEKNFGEFARAA